MQALNENCAVIVMTRYPRPGQVKTRLIEALGADGACELHKKMAQHTISTLEPLHDVEIADIFIYFCGGSMDQMRDWLGEELELVPQCSGALGERMATAFAEIFKAGYDCGVIIGTDCPDIEGATVVKALEHLHHADLVLGPAKDGGYYLLGLKQPCPQLFQDIEWGTGRVLEQTVEKAQQQNMRLEYLNTLTDIDTRADLETIKGTFLLP